MLLSSVLAAGKDRHKDRHKASMHVSNGSNDDNGRGPSTPHDSALCMCPASGLHTPASGYHSWEHLLSIRDLCRPHSGLFGACEVPIASSSLPVPALPIHCIKPKPRAKPASVRATSVPVSPVQIALPASRLLLPLVPGFHLSKRTFDESHVRSMASWTWRRCPGQSCSTHAVVWMQM
jgi:hypothetical protein